MSIPKIVHYCWLSNDPIPESLQQCMASWKKFLPDYEFWLWNFDRFDINSSVWVKESFEKKKFAFAADYIRCYALYNYGGIYLDMDVEVLKPFDDLLHLPYFICQQCETVGYEAAIIGATDHSPIFEKMMAYYLDRHFISNQKYDTTPIPKIIEDVLRANFRIKFIKDITEFEFADGVASVFSSDWFSPKSYRDGRLHLTSNSYTIHHFAGSWLDSEEKYIKELRWKLRLFPANIKSYIARFIGICKFRGISIAFRESIGRIGRKYKCRF